MPSENVEQLIAHVRGALQAAWGNLKKVKGFDVPAIVAVLADVVLQVERMVPMVGKLSGEDKKQVAVAVLNEFIDFPLLPEWLEAKVISLLIDAIVGAANKWFGHGWGMLVGLTDK